MKGKFITFEGIDGAGKSTQAARLAAWMRHRHGLTVVETREPGGTAFAEQVREIVLHATELDSITETLLMFAARREHLKRRIMPALTKGAWVVCDRFNDSSVAYQGGGRGVSEDLIDTLTRHVGGSVVPHLTIYIASPSAESPMPLLSREVFERENGEFFQRVATAYKTIAKENKARVAVVGSLDDNKKRRSVEDVENEIRMLVQNRLLP